MGFISFFYMVVYIYESQPKPFFGGNFQLRSLIFFLTPLKHQDKLVNKADSIYSYLLCPWVRNTAVED